MRALVCLAVFAPAIAEANECKVIELDFMPAEISIGAPMRAPSQIVAWVEDVNGRYVDTVFITQETGTFGLGNRPGRFDFNSGPKWPYGRRVTVFPIWAHKRAASGAPIWGELVFQDGDDDNLSHAARQSSPDVHFCRPQASNEASWDAGTCATMSVGTDKGVFSASKTNPYPPRNDLSLHAYDDPSVEMFASLNPFDAVSAATPPSGVRATLALAMPETIPNDDYVLWFEISREFDHNATYSPTAYPSPQNIPWMEYGEPFRGQPSIVYKVPIRVGPTVSVASTLDYVGYGDPDGLDGNVRVPDSTITTDVPGSGASRLAIISENGETHRLRVTTRVEIDNAEPARPNLLDVNTLTSSSATIEFVAPGDDGVLGKVRAYEIRYVSGSELTEDNFASAIELKPDLVIGPPGTLQEFTMTGLLFDTEYTIGVRALDDCRNTGALATLTFRTPERAGGEVDACFVATAAYGTAMANDVEALRSFRDQLLSSTVLGELVVETYYTFGPAVAGVIGESELLRASARAVLEPIITWVRRF